MRRKDFGMVTPDYENTCLKPFKRRNRMCHSRSDDEITCLKVQRASVDIKIENKLM